jgi:hypothetical protein
MATGRPRYGSRKIFFQRVWARLHAGAPLDDIVDDVLESAAVEAASVEEEPVSNDEETKRKLETEDGASLNKKTKVDVTNAMAV